MNIDLNGKRALVCGASKGIGRASAELLAGMGAELIVAARSGSLLDELIDALPGAGASHQRIEVDFDHPDDAVAKLRSATDGPIHILVNNAGGPPGGPIIDADPAAFLEGFRRHLLMNQRLVQALVPGMREARYGRIINIVSTSVREPIPGLGVSNSIRGAVAGWAKTLAFELGPDAITVNNVLPGFTDTERLASLISTRARSQGASEEQVADRMRAQVPFGRFAEPREVASMVAFLASPAAAYVSGQSIAVDGARMRSI